MTKFEDKGPEEEPNIVDAVDEMRRLLSESDLPKTVEDIRPPQYGTVEGPAAVIDGENFTVTPRRYVTYEGYEEYPVMFIEIQMIPGAGYSTLLFMNVDGETADEDIPQPQDEHLDDIIAEIAQRGVKHLHVTLSRSEHRSYQAIVKGLEAYLQKHQKLKIGFTYDSV